MSDLLKEIKTRVLVGPGDLPTAAANLGFDLTNNPAWWAFNHPEEFKGIVKSWLSAGCDYTDAYTEHSHWSRLKKFGLQDKAVEVTRKLLQLTREVTPPDRFVCARLTRASIFAPPLGTDTMEEVIEGLIEQIKIVEEVGADLLLGGVASADEIEPTIKVMREYSKLPLVMLVSFNPTPKGFRTLMGLDPATATRKFKEAKVDIIGIICGGISYDDTTQIIKDMEAIYERPFYAKPNAGIPELVHGQVSHPGTPEMMARCAQEWVKAGARMVCGCCGTTPEHIAKVASVLKGNGAKR